jgi:fructokinase
VFGAIEAGGTKFVCGIGTGPEDLRTIQIPTRAPDETLKDVVGFFRESGTSIRALGIGSFGPIDLDLKSKTYGYITSTPKQGWGNYDLAGNLSRVLHVPTGFDTDVNAAALGEQRWGAAAGLTDFIYLTVGTGIGGGVFAGGAVLHGHMHPEMGHIPIPHNRSEDPFPGNCPYHADCLEGLAAGPAMHARWGVSPDQIPPHHEAWALEARYLALGLATWICTLSPKRIIMGGGVMSQAHIFNLLRRDVSKFLNGYIQTAELMGTLEDYIVPPALGSRAGVLGALVLAEQAI